MDTNSQNKSPQQWDKKRQEIDQLTAIVKRLNGKLKAIKELAASFPDELRQQIDDILEERPAGRKSE